MDENLREVKYQLFSMKFTPITPSSPMSKSLYHQEDNMNNLEQNVALKISSLDNVVFWHRNLTRGRGFYINGYSSNHYPDFIIYTKKNNVILIETKGDYLANEETLEKNKLGKLYVDKAGSNYKYFMVFEKANVEGCYNEGSIVEVLRRL